MGLASHLGPWRLGTVKSTTGTTAGTINNMGVTQCIQKKAVAFGDTAASTAFVLPAGAMILGAQLYATTAFTTGSTGTLKLSIGATDITATTTITGSSGVGVFNLALTGLSAAAAALLLNVGTTDAIVTYTMSTLTAGAGTIAIEYAVCLADGTYNPTAQTA